MGDTRPLLINHLKANLALIKREQLEAELGLRYDVVKSVVGRLSAVITGVDVNSVLTTKRPLTAREWAVFHHLERLLITQPAYDGSQLFDELKGLLIDRNLLLPVECESLERVRRGIDLYTISRMHLSRILLEPGHAELRFAHSVAQQDNSRLYVYADYVLPPPRDNTRISAPIYQSQYGPDEAFGETMRSRGGPLEFQLEHPSA